MLPGMGIDSIPFAHRGIPCLTLRDETEWVETVESGWNQLVGADFDQITTAVMKFRIPDSQPLLYGDGEAAKNIIEILKKYMS